MSEGMSVKGWWPFLKSTKKWKSPEGSFYLYRFGNSAPRGHELHQLEPLNHQIRNLIEGQLCTRQVWTQLPGVLTKSLFGVVGPQEPTAKPCALTVAGVSPSGNRSHVDVRRGPGTPGAGQSGKC